MIKLKRNTSDVNANRDRKRHSTPNVLHENPSMFLSPENKIK